MQKYLLFFCKNIKNDKIKMIFASWSELILIYGTSWKTKLIDQIILLSGKYI